MRFRLIPLILAVVIATTFSARLFSQDATAPASSEPAKEEHGTAVQPAASDTQPAAGVPTAPALKEDVPAEKPKELTKEEVILQSAKGGKIYCDGYTTFINSKVLFELGTKDNIYEDTIYYKLDSGEIKLYSGPFAIEQEGKHVVSYYSVDKMGNQEPARDINVVCDNTAPVITVNMNAPFVKTGDKLYASESFVYTYTIDSRDDLSGVSSVVYSTDGDNYEEFVGPVKVTAKEPPKLKIVGRDRVNNLATTYTSKVIDEAGNVLGSAETVNIIVDKTAPAVEIKADKEFTVKDGKKIASRVFKYVVTATDTESGLGTVLYRIDNRGEYNIYTDAIVFSTNGEHVIEAIARDKVGNVSQTAILNVYVDTVPPVSEIKMVSEK